MHGRPELKNYQHWRLSKASPLCFKYPRISSSDIVSILYSVPRNNCDKKVLEERLFCRRCCSELAKNVQKNASCKVRGESLATIWVFSVAGVVQQSRVLSSTKIHHAEPDSILAEYNRIYLDCWTLPEYNPTYWLIPLP